MLVGSPSSGDQAKTLRFLPMLSDCILVKLASLDEALALFEFLVATKPAGVLEIIPAALTVMIVFDVKQTSVQNLKAVIASLSTDRVQTPEGTHLETPVHDDGDDLSAVASMMAQTCDEVARLNTQGDYFAAVTGFAPGFAYLANRNPRLCVPRWPSPRTIFPAGSVGLADAFSGVYPKASQGGWQLIRTTPLALFDIGSAPGSLLRPGQRFRDRYLLTDAADSSQTKPNGPSFSSRANPGRRSTTAVIEVVSVGFPVLFQDLDRPGLTEPEISRSGAADRASLKGVNRLVGNTPRAVALEITSGDFGFLKRGRGGIAVTGAKTPNPLKTATGAVIRLSHHQAFALEDGDIATVGAAQAGSRANLSMRGGFDVAPVLGSRATDKLAEIGPEPLKAGNLHAQPEALT